MQFELAKKGADRIMFDGVLVLEYGLREMFSLRLHLCKLHGAVLRGAKWCVMFNLLRNWYLNYCVFSDRDVLDKRL